jgi:protein-L-isoaspartate(D-aspartate) O-methyltransferase
MSNIAQFNMVEQQIRPWNVRSPALLEAISGLDRALFVPQVQQALCYFDYPINLDGTVRMLEPRVAARLIQALDIRPDDHVLLVGAGSGYSGALCSMLARTVVCQDTSQLALDRAEKNCASAGIDNIGFQKVEGLYSPADDVQYDAILVREAMTELPDTCLKRLVDNGRCVALIGRDHVLELIRCTRDGENIKQESVIDILKPLNERNAGSAQVKGSFVF